MKFKYIFLAIIFLIIGKIAVTEVFDNRPFKFEKYKSTEELEEAAKSKFRIGDDIEKVSTCLKKSGAKCYSYKSSSNISRNEFTVICEYNTWFLSLHPLEYYRIGFGVDKYNKIVDVETLRVTGTTLIIP